MYDDTTLPGQAHQVIDTRVRRASEARRARAARVRGQQRHRLADQLRAVAERLDT